MATMAGVIGTSPLLTDSVHTLITFDTSQVTISVP